jgi:putative ABC transport system permease protein
MLTNMVNAFGLGAIGVFTSMFVSFLDRRRDLGIMKTLGIDNAHSVATVSTEIVFAGAMGTLFGIISALLVTGYCLKGVSGNYIAMPWTVAAAGTGVSCLILVAATHIPRAMARQATVMELLYGRPIPIYGQRY